MAFVYNKKEVGGEIVYEAEGAAAGGASVEIAGVVFDAAAIAEFLYHLEVVVDAFFETFGFKRFVDGVEIVALLEHVGLNLAQGGGHVLFGGEEVAGGVDDCLVVSVDALPAYGVEAFNGFDFIVPEANTVAEVGKGGENVDGVAFYTEASVGEFYFVADVLCVEELEEEGVAPYAVADFNVYGASFEFLGVADAVDAADRADDNHVATPAEECRGGAETEFVEVVVDGKVFFDVGVGGGDVGFGLVVVVVGDEILHGVVGEELLEFAVELRGEGFVMAED